MSCVCVCVYIYTNVYTQCVYIYTHTHTMCVCVQECAGITPASLMSPALAGRLFTTRSPSEPRLPDTSPPSATVVLIC